MLNKDFSKFGKHFQENLVQIMFEDRVFCDQVGEVFKIEFLEQKYLQQFVSEKKVAVLGDMGELGDMQTDMHMSIIPSIIAAGVSKLFLVGNLMNQIKDKLPDDMEIKSYKDINEMIADNNINFEDGQIILIKGSRSMKLENLAKNLGVKSVL